MSLARKLKRLERGLMKEEITKYFARYGRKGGKKAAENMSAAERSERARKAGIARQAAAKKKRGDQ